MTKIEELLARRAEIDSEIAQQKQSAISQVRDFMLVMGVTIEDLLGRPLPAPAAKRPVKYRDESGNTWTGVGQRPRWLKARLAAGASLEQFGVQK